MSRGSETVKLEPKAMSVLVHLASRPGEVVRREALEDATWAGMVVGYDALSNTIIKLRKAFGDSARCPEIIETISESGYRLIPDVTFAGSPGDPEAGARFPRKLVAILYADVAGYSRLTGADGDSTHRALSEHLDRISATVGEYRGRVTHHPGDAVLAIFGAAVDAVSCAARL